MHRDTKVLHQKYIPDWKKKKKCEWEFHEYKDTDYCLQFLVKKLKENMLHTSKILKNENG